MRAPHRLLVVSATSLVLAAGCSSSSPPPRHAAAPSTVLSQLAARALSISYTAHYAVHYRRVAPLTSLVVYRTPLDLRVDLITAVGTSSLIVTGTGDIACEIKPRHRVCLRLRAGHVLPPALDPGVEHLFSGYLVALRQYADRYSVQVAPVLAKTGLPRGTKCFYVVATGSTPAPTVPRGDYCFSPAGIPAGTSFASGYVVLTSYTTTVPARSFRPAASPTPLP
jgi:hypothetical protein